MPKMPKTTRKTFSLKDTKLKTWFERDRAHVDLQDRKTGRTLIEFWDEDVEQLLEDGFLDRRDLHGSLYKYAVHLGALKAPKIPPRVGAHSTIGSPPVPSARVRTTMPQAKKTPPAQLNREIAEALARKTKQHHSAISDDTKIHDAIARFPPTFGLRGFPGSVFRLSPTSSYISDGNVILYTQRKEGDRWFDFSKGTEPELRGEIVSPPSANGRTTRSHASRPDRNIIVRPTPTRWPGGVKVRVVKFGDDVRQGVRAVMPVGSLAVMHPDAGERLPDGTVRVHEDDLRDTAN